jgi:hypothetical protein
LKYNFIFITDEVEDLHICGTCRETFSNINLFVKHKKECKSKKTSNAADLELVQRNEEQKQTQTKYGLRAFLKL